MTTKTSKEVRGQRLQRLREEAGYTQSDIARLFDVTDRTVARWESGGAAMSLDDLVRFSNLYHVSTDYLLGLVDDPTSTASRNDLSPAQAMLVDLVDRGLTVEAMEILLRLTKGRGSLPLDDTQPSDSV